MANNRMYLVNSETKEKVMLAKYYPSTGWYVKYNDLAYMLNEFFEGTAHHSSDGPCNYKIEFEELGKL